MEAQRMVYKTVVAVVLIILVMIFAVQNAAVVDIRFLFWQVEFPRSLLIFLMLLVGVVIGWVTRSIFRISRK